MAATPRPPSGEKPLELRIRDAKDGEAIVYDIAISDVWTGPFRQTIAKELYVPSLQLGISNDHVWVKENARRVLEGANHRFINILPATLKVMKQMRDAKMQESVAEEEMRAHVSAQRLLA